MEEKKMRIKDENGELIEYSNGDRLGILKDANDSKNADIKDRLNNKFNNKNNVLKKE